MSNPRPTLFLALTFVVALTACTAAAPGVSTSPPASTAAPSTSPSFPDHLVLPIATPEAAMAAIVAVEPKFAGIGPQDPDLIGQSAWYDAKPASGVGAFVVTIHVGWGDCPSGCIERHTWTYAVTPDGTATLMSEGGDAVPSGAMPSPGG